MANLVDYIYWRGDLPFSLVPFNELDNLVLSMTSYVDFAGIVPESISRYRPTLREAMELYKLKSGGSPRLGLIIPDDTMDIMLAAAKSSRFGNLQLVGYRNEIDHELVLQFSAVTFLFPDGSAFVAFRGTDDTITGWKEDLNLCLPPQIPAELRSAAYLREIASLHSGLIRIGGHSKGGHLAIRAAAEAEPVIQKRITAVYSNDGPGFHPEFYLSEGYLAIRENTATYIPQSSIIGTLLEQDDDHCCFIRSTGTGPLQHNAISWSVTPLGFERLDRRSKFGIQSDEAIDRWLSKLDFEKRKLILKDVFGVLDAPGVKTLTEFQNSGFRSAQAMIRATRDQDPETKKMVLQLFRRFLLPEAETNNPKERKGLKTTSLQRSLPVTSRPRTEV